MALTPSISSVSGKKSNLHPYHIVDPSPWPRVVAFTAFFLVLGLALYRHAYLIGYTLFSFGLVATIINSAFWWRDVVREATFEGHHTLSVQNGLRFGRILFIVSEVRLFFAFFWAFFHASLSPSPQIGAVWPPKGIEVISPWLIPLLNTGLLLTSGASLTWSHAALLGGYRREARAGLVLTVLLASVFTLLQGYEYVNAPFSIADGIYGSTFYRLTGLHGRHVLVGTIFLAVSLYRRARHHYTLSTHLGFECAAWYWHFVDVVWIFLFLAVYTWGEGVLFYVVLPTWSNDQLTKPMALTLYGRPLPSHRTLENALTVLYGRGGHRAKETCQRLGLAPSLRVEDLTSAQESALASFLKETYTLAGALQEREALDRQRLFQNGSRRGLRRHAGLPAHGQRSRSNGRTAKRLRNLYFALSFLLRWFNFLIWPSF
jgi:cytochrome c oxidase subunit 3